MFLENKYLRFVRHHRFVNTALTMIIFGITATVFAGQPTGGNDIELGQSLLELFSSPGAYILFSTGAAVGWGVSQRTSVKALNQRLDECKVLSEEFNEIRDKVLKERLNEKG